jgi:hypothetical protein
MLLPQDGKPAHSEIFPFSSVMDMYDQETLRSPESSVIENLNCAMAKVLNEAKTYVKWIKDPSYEVIKTEILRGLFEGWGLIDFPRSFLIEEAERNFSFGTRYKSNKLPDARARDAIQNEMYATGTLPDQIDTQAAANYLVSGLVEQVGVSEI